MAPSLRSTAGLGSSLSVQASRPARRAGRAPASSPSGRTRAPWSSARACTSPTWQTSLVRKPAGLTGHHQSDQGPDTQRRRVPSTPVPPPCPAGTSLRVPCPQQPARVGADQPRCAGSPDEGLEQLLAGAPVNGTGRPHSPSPEPTLWRAWTHEELEQAREEGAWPCLLGAGWQRMARQLGAGGEAGVLAAVCARLAHACSRAVRLCWLRVSHAAGHTQLCELPASRKR